MTLLELTNYINKTIFDDDNILWYEHSDGGYYLKTFVNDNKHTYLNHFKHNEKITDDFIIMFCDGVCYGKNEFTITEYHINTSFASDDGEVNMIVAVYVYTANDSTIISDEKLVCVSHFDDIETLKQIINLTC